MASACPSGETVSAPRHSGPAPYRMLVLNRLSRWVSKGRVEAWASLPRTVPVHTSGHSLVIKTTPGGLRGGERGRAPGDGSGRERPLQGQSRVWCCPASRAPLSPRLPVCEMERTPFLHLCLTRWLQGKTRFQVSVCQGHMQMDREATPVLRSLCLGGVGTPTVRRGARSTVTEGGACPMGNLAEYQHLLSPAGSQMSFSECSKYFII